MSKTTVTVGVLVDDYSVSFIEVCEGYNISEQQLLEILEHGLISSIETPFTTRSRFKCCRSGPSS